MEAHRLGLPLAVGIAVVAAGAATFLLRPRTGLIEPAPVAAEAYFSPSELDRAEEYRGPQRALAIGGLAVLRGDARALFDDLTSGAGLGCVLVSAAAGISTLALVWVERFDAARFTAAIAVAGITVGWGVAQHPALLPAALTVDHAAAPHATLVALVASIGIGLLIIGPCLVALYRMALTDRLGEGFSPLGTPFGPGRAGEPERPPS